PLLLPPARHVLPLFFLRTPRPPTSSLFPYTTLFRSDDLESIEESDARFEPLRKRTTNLYQRCENYAARLLRLSDEAFPDALHKRSEEHTSELQSLTNIVCRLLLEKKKYHTTTSAPHT